MKKCIWGFILAVAATDVYFTWEGRGSVGEWESNPVAEAVFKKAGILGAIAYRGLWLGYAGLLARTKTQWTWVITPTWAAGHLYLLVTLVRVYPYLQVLQS
jgi:hypothetical protein